jgi:hypothetical protein
MLQEQKPRIEPEIIPLGYRDQFSTRLAYRFVGAHGVRIYTFRPRPLGIILLTVVIATVLATMLVVLVGAVLIWIPVVILTVAAAVASVLRR